MRFDTLAPRSSTATGLIQFAKHERCMYKVHEQLREVNEKAYKPVLLAIGPSNDQGMVGGGFMQQHKLRYLEQMLERTKRSVEAYIKALREMREIASKCYVECISQTTDEFLEMMLLDGCFIIELFRKYEIYQKTGDCHDDPIFQMKWVLPRIARDLLLFENQLPFFVLAKLLEINERNSEEHTVIIEERDESIVECSSYIVTLLIDLALGFFSDFLPFECKFDESREKSTKNVTSLLGRVRVCERLEIWFRFKNGEFEHLLGLVHASISISILDVEKDRYISEPQARRNLPEKSKHQHGSESQDAGVERSKGAAVNSLLEKMYERGSKRLEQMNLSMATPYGSESQAQRNVHLQGSEKSKHLQDSQLREAVVKSNMAKEFKDHLEEIHRWMEIPQAINLQEAGIKLDEAESSFKHLEVEYIANTDYRNTHSATELEEAGIKFKAAKDSKVVSIKFKNGHMEISPLRIVDETETYLRNLMAYEQYCDRDNNFDYISQYVCFLDDLINTPKDVELLRRRRIIRNYLGDDEATSTMFNKLGHNIVISYGDSIYVRTSMDLNKYCSQRYHKWMASARHDYFSSPWTFFSVLAAVLLLFLTIAQTIISVVP